MDLTGAIDGAVTAIVLIAAARGLARGLIREVFSIAALAAAVLAVRGFSTPFGAWLDEATQGQLGSATAPWVAGAALAIAAVAVVAIAGRVLRRGARAAGLGFADRLAGGAVGAAEGLLVVGLLLLGTTRWMGPDHPALAASRSVQAFEDLQALVVDREALPDVAAGRADAAAAPRRRAAP